MKIINIMILVFVFIIINLLSYLITKIFLEQNIDIVLKNNMKTLDTHYQILHETQKTSSEAIYRITSQNKQVIKILSEANNASKIKKDKLRKKFHKIIQPLYEIIKIKGVLQYQFLLSNNESFYRAHKPSKFGDDLSDVRADFKYVNKTKKPIRGFVQGRVAHGFRNTFPLFDENHKHIGAVEVSFSSDSFQWYLNTISNIHSHFLVNENIFDFKSWQRDDLILKYYKCAEAKNYMISLGDTHTKFKCIDNNRIRLKPIKDEIVSKIKLGNVFSTYIRDTNDVVVVSFLPIKSLDNKTAAWIVSYENSPIITSVLVYRFYTNLVVFFLSLVIVYFLYKQIVSREKIQKQKIDLHKQHKFLDEILNLTDNIIFITDFRKIKFSNNRFKETFIDKNCVLDSFIESDEYLHKGLLNKNENFINLVNRTPLKDRIVMMQDKHFNNKTFKISISKSENKGDYLVTLSDITKIKEHHIQTQRKADIDALTQVYNRSKFDEILRAEFIQAKKYKNIFSIALIDIDKFKVFNDLYGHLIGDEVLIKMANTISKYVRDSDIFARWGGEEFVILFRNISIDKAVIASKKLKDLIEENEHEIAGRITASFGVTEYKDGDTEATLFKRCDEALYLAKKNGRNRIETL